MEQEFTCTCGRTLTSDENGFAQCRHSDGGCGVLWSVLEKPYGDRIRKAGVSVYRYEQELKRVVEV